MSALLQGVLVGVLVAGSAAYSLWRLLPPRRRLRLLDGLDRLRIATLQPVLARARSRALAQLTGGCGACPSARPSRTPGALRR